MVHWATLLIFAFNVDSSKYIAHIFISWINNTIKESARAHLIESQGVKAVKSMPFAVNPANSSRYQLKIKPITMRYPRREARLRTSLPK
ncbi:hypothetical protein NTPn27_00960 [Streptococcus pneumoniae]|nr:hypothetical protein NTPn27_00960 [Streptococcus pneumoniae]KXW42509.1 hypothetical protein NTPn44_00855 [Streptococcus pneumoniae]OYL09610.1 hypothetical protein AK85_08075 [Streptococcus pneumoniae B1598]HEV6238516.1 hypothetical protein [Streptococcus pneumoniae]